MSSFALVTMLSKLSTLRIVLVHALCQTIYFSQRSAVAKVDVMMTTNVTNFEHFRKLSKIVENE